MQHREFIIKNNKIEANQEQQLQILLKCIYIGACLVFICVIGTISVHF